MLSRDTPVDDDQSNMLDLLMGIVPLFDELEAEQQKLYAHIVNNERRIAALEAILHGLQLIPGYQTQISLVDNVTMAFGMVNTSIAMARAVLAAQGLPAAQARAAKYLASLGVSAGVDSAPGRVDDTTRTSND